MSHLVIIPEGVLVTAATFKDEEQVYVRVSDADDSVILGFENREALKEVAFMLTHMLAETEEAPSEEDAPGSEPAG